MAPEIIKVIKDEEPDLKLLTHEKRTKKEKKNQKCPETDLVNFSKYTSVNFLFGLKHCSIF